MLRPPLDNVMKTRHNTGMSNHSRSTALVGALAVVLSHSFGVIEPAAQAQNAPAPAEKTPASPPTPQPTTPPVEQPVTPPAPAPGAPTAPPPPSTQPETPLPRPVEPVKRTLAPGTEVILILKEGNRVTGILVEEGPDAIKVRIAGIETTFRSEMIERYEVMRPILERYEEMRKAIGDDPDGLATLAEWLRSREQHELALREVNRLLAIDPNHTEGKRLKLLIDKQIELKSRSKAAPPKATGPAPAPTAPAARSAEHTFPLLTDSQINLLKVFEIDLDDPPRMTIKRTTITKLIEQNIGTPHIPVTQEGRDAIYRKTPSAILDLMFKLRARDLYPEVQVLDQPKSMKAFRDDVHAAWLVNACATTACHGGEDAGRLMLFPNRPRADSSFYTNFLILDKFRMADGTALINYEQPERSPLLQLGLPREDSLFRHPEVARGSAGRDTWKATFKDTQERAYKRTVDWIKLMYHPRPEYPIEYQPPRPSVVPPKDPAKATPR